MNNIKQLLKPEEVAYKLGLSKSMVYKLMQQGIIPCVKIGRSVRVRPVDLEDFINQQLVHTPEVQNDSTEIY